MAPDSSGTPDESLNSTSSDGNKLLTAVKGEKRFNVLLTNARSIRNKIQSLIVKFNELSTHVALISETWLGRNKGTNAELAGVEKSEDIGLIRRDRVLRGGGVCVMYDNNRAHFKEYEPVKHN